MRGEACVVHLLHAAQPGSDALCRLPDARIIIKGTAVNQDGRSSSLTVRMAKHSKPLGPQLFLTSTALTSAERQGRQPGGSATSSIP